MSSKLLPDTEDSTWYVRPQDFPHKCDSSVGASRSMKKPSTSMIHGYVPTHHHAPPHHPHPPPPSPQSSPPPPSPSPSLSPPPPPSLPPPELSSPPPPEQVRRRLLVAPPNCTQSPPVGAPFYPFDPSPAPAPYPFGPDEPSPSPAPAPSSGFDFGLPPPVGDNNSTGAHTTRVSAMKFNQCTYTIITCTGNIEGASTTADVNAEFSNQFGESVLFVNLKSQNRNFNRGATDTFTLVGDCVPNICKLHLSHDDSGPSPGWFVNTVTVSLLYQTHVFNVFEWLAKDEPPYSLSRTISSCPAA